MGKYRRRAVDGDLPAPTRVWSRFLPRQEPVLLSPLTESLQAKKLGFGHRLTPCRRRAHRRFR